MVKKILFQDSSQGLAQKVSALMTLLSTWNDLFFKHLRHSKMTNIFSFFLTKTNSNNVVVFVYRLDDFFNLL